MKSGDDSCSSIDPKGTKDDSKYLRYCKKPPHFLYGSLESCGHQAIGNWSNDYHWVCYCDQYCSSLTLRICGSPLRH